MYITQLTKPTSPTSWKLCAANALCELLKACKVQNGPFSIIWVQRLKMY